jgi:trk system potassium uptake protein TrkH
MLYRDICKTLSFYMWILLIPLSIPFFIAVYCEWIVGSEIYPQPPAAFAFFLTIILTTVLGVFFWFIGKHSTGHLYRREALLLVLLVYLLTPVIGSLPFFFNGTLSNPVDAVFEAVSGITTTGASIMQAKKINPGTGRTHQS